MLLEITTTHRPATDLGYLLHKNPARAQAFTLAFGTAHVFYPQATDDVCRACLLLDIDPIALTRGRVGGPAPVGFALQPYVNDRPFAASSYLSVAIAQVLRSALAGASKERTELALTAIPLTAIVPVVATPPGDNGALLTRLFAPLGYDVAVDSGEPLDPKFPTWGASPYARLTLTGTQTVSDLLSHLYVLLPALDGEKHYWEAPDEVDKLLRAGDGWLRTHPECDLIVRRYLRRRRSLFTEATARLLAADGGDDALETSEVEAGEVETGETGEAVEATNAVEEAAPAVAGDAAPATADDSAAAAVVTLHDQRLLAARDALITSGVRSVVDLGCGEGKLIALLLNAPQFARITGMDVSPRELSRARRKLRLEEIPRRAERVTLLQGSLAYRDARLAGHDAAAVVEVTSTEPTRATKRYGPFDAAVLMEVLEHIEPNRLPQVERNVFGSIRPRRIIISTPNADHNTVWDSLPQGAFRHSDHRFEWTRAQFEAWCRRNAEAYGYTVVFSGIGDVDLQGRGAPTQMAVFDLASGIVPG